MPGAVVVTGLAELQRSLAASGPAVEKAMKTGLRETVEPISKKAEGYSRDRISGVRRGRPKGNPAWAITRIGVTRESVYIVPKRRGVPKGHYDDPRRRPNLVGLMLDKSFFPALEEGTPLVEARVTQLIQEVLDAT